MTGDAAAGDAATTDARTGDSEQELAAARARAGRAIRDIGHAFIGRHATVEQIDRLAGALESIGAELWPAEPRFRRFEPEAARQDADYPQGPITSSLADRPISGSSSPWGLDVELHRLGDEIEGRVTFRAAHEGAPGRSHGGIVAALFDDVFGYVLGVHHQPAFTGDLYIRYAAPTPLHRVLACRVRLADRIGRRLLMTGELVDVESGTVVVTAKATFVAVDPAAFADQTAERPAPPDEA